MIKINYKTIVTNLTLLTVLLAPYIAIFTISKRLVQIQNELHSTVELQYRNDLAIMEMWSDNNKNWTKRFQEQVDNDELALSFIIEMNKKNFLYYEEYKNYNSNKDSFMMSIDNMKKRLDKIDKQKFYMIIE